MTHDIMIHNYKVVCSIDCTVRRKNLHLLCKFYFNELSCQQKVWFNSTRIIHTKLGHIRNLRHPILGNTMHGKRIRGVVSSLRNRYNVVNVTAECRVMWWSLLNEKFKWPWLNLLAWLLSYVCDIWWNGGYRSDLWSNLFAFWY